jgi:hypothetical protein
MLRQSFCGKPVLDSPLNQQACIWWSEAFTVCIFSRVYEKSFSFVDFSTVDGQDMAHG